MNPAHITWCRNQFDIIAHGGVWAVPRSGLVFRKNKRPLEPRVYNPTEDTFELIDILPWWKDMGKGFAWGFDVAPTKEKLLEFQRNDFASIKAHFNAAGIQITDPKGLLK